MRSFEFRRGRGVIRADGVVEVGHAVTSPGVLELLAILARYLVLVSDRDNAATAIAGSIPTV